MFDRDENCFQTSGVRYISGIYGIGLRLYCTSFDDE